MGVPGGGRPRPQGLASALNAPVGDRPALVLAPPSWAEAFLSCEGRFEWHYRPLDDALYSRSWRIEGGLMRTALIETLVDLCEWTIASCC